jgi:hypothetical protein
MHFVSLGSTLLGEFPYVGLTLLPDKEVRLSFRNIDIYRLQYPVISPKPLSCLRVLGMG